MSAPKTTRALDPIVSLSVAIAESPGSYAFLLGSGVSRDAGVPTGTDVFWRTVGALHRLEAGSEETPDREALEAWLEETGRSDLTYSAVLELVAPSQEERRSYLASLFEGREPGETHRRLAALAKEGVVTVFVTTNFDRLLEQALLEVGVTPVVVTSDADLAVAPAREHAGCYVVKPHGDYLQQTIRNTEEELASLDLGLTGELQAIFDRYGLVVLGYSGSDKAIAACLRGRRSRYGLYWLSRTDELDEPARTLVEANSGRVIVRSDAASFLTDLDRMIALYRAHPTGQTPELVNAEVVNLLRERDDVGLRELLKGERRRIEEAARAGVTAHRGSNDLSDYGAFGAEMMPAIERYIAAVFPLIDHRSALWAEEVQALAAFAGERLFDEGLVSWIEMPRWIAWYVTYAAGGFAIAADNLDACRELLEAPVRDDFYVEETLGTLRAGDSGVRVGTAAMQVIEPKNWNAPHFEHVVRSLADNDFLRARYPEFAADQRRLFENLSGFNALATMYAAKHETRVEGDWTMYRDGARAFVSRFVRDSGYRARVAEILGMGGDELVEAAPTLLNEGSWKPGGWIAADIDPLFRRR